MTKWHHRIPGTLSQHLADFAIVASPSVGSSQRARSRTALFRSIACQTAEVRVSRRQRFLAHRGRLASSGGTDCGQNRLTSRHRRMARLAEKGIACGSQADRWLDPRLQTATVGRENKKNPSQAGAGPRRANRGTKAPRVHRIVPTRQRLVNGSWTILEQALPERQAQHPPAKSDRQLAGQSRNGRIRALPASPPQVELRSWPRRRREAQAPRVCNPLPSPVSGHGASRAAGGDLL